MIGIRMLAAATAYCVVLLEVYSGAIQGPIWWVAPGALVIALLSALSIFGLGNTTEQNNGSAVAGFFQWTLIIGTAIAMSYFANYFGREMLPEILAEAAIAPQTQIQLPMSVPETGSSTSPE